MCFFDLLKNLNHKQKTVVSAPKGNILVLAGAGSGKTRVLVHRIAWLLLIKHCSPSSIFAVTFTNKAAAEMRHRIKKVVGSHFGEIWIGTFHSLAYRLLRIHYIAANLPQDFQIIDSEDQQRLLKRLIRYLNLDEKEWPPRQAMWYINTKKDAGRRPQNIDKYGNQLEITWQRIYEVYQDTCDRTGLVDFAELILRTYEMLLNHDKLMHYYRERFNNILVDEFQDTNQIQYSWIRMLAGHKGHVTIVGDDDQSIYGWRGAQAENMQRFLHDFPSAQTIRLEQNYRSTKNILKAANHLISNNYGRLVKNLWTDRADGEHISLYSALNELDEARFVVNSIKVSKKNGKALKESVILYRSNAQSRVLEEALLHIKIPYHIYGGMRFFERQEVKDALAYLRLITNRNDDVAYERMVNTPIRGIGAKTIEVVRKIACERQLSLWQASLALLDERVLKSSTALALQRFIELVDKLTQDIVNLPLYMQTHLVIKNSGLWAMYKEEKGDKSQARIKNLEELVTAAREYLYKDDTKDILSLQGFLSHAALDAEKIQADACQDAVQLMTLHAAKGLEFQQVFIVGLEEGMFPSQMALEEEGGIEEERRLAYVGITRAITKLTITYAETRRLYGKQTVRRKSRFINELPPECIEEVRTRDKY
ncbi:DNA helicase II [Candidatus Palibaumannia cicadellinicola]|uniref:DNA 3'-5' helicase n=1 Tax=Candidatus Palibaumannia cicadellinicola TaxID=186490 RepID=A0A088MXK1_9GAMM|nr:DNA helicase II [Candidatus Baumannia cicadellinicola]AIN47032.1 ATP-dependent DNA helicase UvrD/PcrA [Candidatus Baumannia cicadellinicola]